MTANKDQTETLVEQALARRAEQAPPDGFLLSRVHSRLRRRRAGRRMGAALAAATAVAAGIAGVNLLSTNDAVLTTPHSSPVTGKQESAQTGALPDGWRWESFRTVEVAIPGDWGHGTTGTPACTVRKIERPYVGRPGPIPSIGCDDWTVKLPYRSSYLWLGDDRTNVGVRQRGSGWVEETRTVAGVRVTVFTNDTGLRQRILGSIRPIDGTDVNGCTPGTPQAARPGGRPVATRGLDSLGTVGKVTVCDYRMMDGQNSLFASSMITGPAAGKLVDAIRSAPPGSGPNSPNTCTEKYGSAAIVLKVHGTQGDQDVLLRYHGCDHNGVDDGTTVRKLTRSVVGPVLAGVHYPTSHSGALNQIMPPR